MSTLIGTTDAAWDGKIRLAEADAKPGHYYVTCRDERGRTAYLLGPFTQTTYGQQAHARALGALQRTKRYVSRKYSNSAWWTYGTARVPLLGAPVPTGKLNEIVGRR